MAHALDNVVWHSMTGARSALAERSGRAGRFHPEVSPFGAIADQSPEAWRDLAALLGPGHATSLFGPDIEVPDGWEVLFTVPCGQLVAEHVDTDGDGEELTRLGPDDVPDMLELVAATKPGPFGPRTIEFGGYVGLREGGGGRLIAIAGERLSAGGYTEVSAVCTAADQQGKGLGARMVRAVVDVIRSRGEEGFLHVADTNVNAYRLYLAMGFTVRCTATATVVRSPASRSEGRSGPA